MSKYQAYNDRLGISGASKQESFTNSAKRQQYTYFMNSPNLLNVMINDEIEPVPSIVSRITTNGNFNKRRFLFIPDRVVNKGDYVAHEGQTYLSTEVNSSDIFPEIYGELCNAQFPLLKGITKVKTGVTDFGKPIYTDTIDIENIPCVLTTKTYSLVDNSPMPLPDGAMNIKIPYNPLYKVEINYEIKIRGDQFQVTTVSYEDVVDEIGIIDIRLQRVVNE